GRNSIRVSENIANAYLWMGNAIGCVITENLLGGSIIGSDARGWVVANNVWTQPSVWDESIIDLAGTGEGDSGADGCVVVGNVTEDVGWDFLHADSVAQLVIADNLAKGGGMVLSDCPEAKVTGNRMSVYQDGIAVTSCTD